MSSFAPRSAESMAAFFVRALDEAKRTGASVHVVWGERPLTVTPTMTPHGVAKAWNEAKRAARLKK